MAASRAKVSAVQPAALDRFLRLLFIRKDQVEFRAHERNSRTDEHGDGEHIESIPHAVRTKERKGYSVEQRGQKRWEKRKGLGSGSRVKAGPGKLECNCWNELGEVRLVLYT